MQKVAIQKYGDCPTNAFIEKSGQQHRQACLFVPINSNLTKALEIDARRPKRDRRSALKLFGELQAAGFDGDYSRVTEFVRNWRQDGGQAMVLLRE